MSAPETGSATTIKTLERGLATLEFVAKHPRGVTAKVISAELGIGLASCYHLLRTLVAEDFLVRVKGGTFDIGSRGASLGNALRSPFLPAPEVSALLTRLHQKTRETVYVSGWHHGAIAMQQFISGDGPLVVGRLDIGFTADMHARASCKSMLAHVDPDLVRNMFEDVPMRQLTANTVKDYHELVDDLAATKRRGYAIDAEEFHVGVTCVSSAFFDSTGTPAGSYTVSFATSMGSERLGVLAADVVEAARLATHMLRTAEPSGQGLPTKRGGRS